MKKIIFIVTVLIVTLASSIPEAQAAGNKEMITTQQQLAERERAMALLSRLNVIKEMDKSSITNVQKRELRNEVRAIRTELKELSGGIYLSVGAIIIILLILILVL